MLPSPFLSTDPQKASAQRSGAGARWTLSLFLFVITEEALSRMLSAAGESNLIRGFKPSSHVHLVSHLQFEDDTLLFCDAEEDQAKSIVVILRCFEAVSSLMINISKSTILGLSINDISLRRQHHRLQSGPFPLYIFQPSLVPRSGAQICLESYWGKNWDSFFLESKVFILGWQNHVDSIRTWQPPCLLHVHSQMPHCCHQAHREASAWRHVARLRRFEKIPPSSLEHYLHS